MKRKKVNQIDPVLLSKYILATQGAMSHMKLQKLLYYIQAWHLVFFEEQPLFDNDFEAWLHGPVLRKVWNVYKNDSILWDNLTISKSDAAEIKNKVEQILSEDQLQLINDVLNEYGDKSAYHLESLTHSEQPWIRARKGYKSDEACDETITKESMAKFYSSLL